MKLEDIQILWEVDCNIDRTELGEESLKIPQLHNKYYKIYSQERLLLKKYETDFKKLKLEKYEFLTQGPSKETEQRGWKIPARGMILKSDIPTYMDADQDIIDLTLKIGYQNEKIDFLESIIKSLINRGFNIKTALDHQKFINGC